MTNVLGCGRCGDWNGTPLCFSLSVAIDPSTSKSPVMRKSVARVNEEALIRHPSQGEPVEDLQRCLRLTASLLCFHNLARRWSWKSWRRVWSSVSLKEHITPLFTELHWLPIAACTKFKSVMLANKVFSGSAPIYLMNPDKGLRYPATTALIRGLSSSNPNTSYITILTLLMDRSTVH